MATTVDNAIRKTLGHLSGVYRPDIDVLAATITDSDDEVQLTHDLHGLGAGDWIEVGNEPMMVVRKLNKTCTVARNVTAHAAEAHTSGAIVTLKPRFLRTEIRDALYDEILALPSTVYAYSDTDVTFTKYVAYANLPVTAGVEPLTVLRAWRDPVTADYDPLKRVQLVVIRGLDTDVATSGYAVQLAPAPLSWGRSTTVKVIYSHRHDLSTWADSTDLEADVGCSEQVVRAVQYAAASRSLLGAAAARGQMDAQGASRNAEENPAGQHASLTGLFERKAGQLLQKEASRLRQLFGVTYE